MDPRNPSFVILKNTLFTLRQAYFKSVNAGTSWARKFYSMFELCKILWIYYVPLWHSEEAARRCTI